MLDLVCCRKSYIRMFNPMDGKYKSEKASLVTLKNTQIFGLIEF